MYLILDLGGRTECLRGTLPGTGGKTERPEVIDGDGGCNEVV